MNFRIAVPHSLNVPLIDRLWFDILAKLWNYQINFKLFFFFLRHDFLLSFSPVFFLITVYVNKLSVSLYIQSAGSVNLSNPFLKHTFTFFLILFQFWFLIWFLLLRVLILICFKVIFMIMCLIRCLCEALCNIDFEKRSMNKDYDDKDDYI